MKRISLAIVGLGPFARNVHLPLCMELGVIPKLLIDLEGFSQEDMPESLEGVEFIKLPLECRFGFDESKPEIQNLIARLRALNIGHVILSSEPLNHLSYIELFHKLKIDVMCDKPLIAERGVDLDLKVVEVLRSNHAKILDLYSQVGSPHLDLNLDFRNSPAHRSIILKAREHGAKYDALPESLAIFYAGGNWYMPKEFVEREGHPFKYGYGTLFHTAFHYVDFISQYLAEIMLVTKDEISGFEVVCFSDSPREVLDRMGNRSSIDVQDLDYMRLDFSQTGSANAHYLIRVKTKRGRSTKIDLELLNCGLSARVSAASPRDNYRGSGRNKTENIRMTISPDCVVFLEEIRAKDQRVVKKIVSQNVGEKLDLTVEDYSDSDKKLRRLPILFNFLMGAHPKNPQIGSIHSSLKLFEILIEANTKANCNGGHSIVNHKV